MSGIKSKRTIVLLLLGLLGCIAAGEIFVATSRFGPGVTVDGFNYISTGKNLAQGKGYITGFDELYITWPPLFPTLMAAGYAVGIEPVVLIRYLNALCLGLIVITCGLIIFHETRSSVLSLLAAALIAVAHPLIIISKMVYTEPLFIFLSLLFLWKAEKIIPGPSTGESAALGGLASLAWLTRYVGAILVLTGVILFILNRTMSAGEKIRKSAVFLAVSCLPMLVWLSRNLLVSGTLTGRVGRPLSFTDFLETLRFSGNIFAWWYLPGPLFQHWMYFGLFGLVAGGLLIASFYWLWKGAGDRPGPKFFNFAIFSFIYVVLVIININLYAIDYSNVIGFFAGFSSFSWEKMETLGTRYLTPLYVPVMILFLVITWRLLQIRKPAGTTLARKVFRLAGFCAILLFIAEIALNVHVTATNISKWKRTGSGGYSTARWRFSESVLYLERLPADAMLISNFPDAISLVTGRDAKMSPRRTDYYNTRALLKDDLKKIGDHFYRSKEPVYMVWFRYHFRKNLCTPRELAGYFRLEPVKELSDGRIFHLLPLIEMDENNK